MTKQHPRFPSPTIVEAVCEIHFSPKDERDWAPTRPFLLYNALEKNFPVMEMVPQARLHVHIGPEGPQQTLTQEGERIRFSREDRTRMIQVAGDVLVFNVLQPCPGWEEVKSQLIDVWEKASPSLQPEKIGRIGLRYINRIVHTEDAKQLSDWLKPTDYIPIGLINSVDGYDAFYESKIDASNRLRITILSVIK